MGSILRKIIVDSVRVVGGRILGSKPLPRANLNWLARAMGRKLPSSVARAPVVQKCILPLHAYVHTNTWEIQFFRYCIAKTRKPENFYRRCLSVSGCHHVQTFDVVVRVSLCTNQCGAFQQSNVLMLVSSIKLI